MPVCHKQCVAETLTLLPLPQIYRVQHTHGLVRQVQQVSPGLQFPDQGLIFLIFLQ